jgi:predicted nucleotide-binding protein
LRRYETLKTILEERLADSKAGEILPNRDTLIAPTNKVFLVHGHDAEVKNAVARFLERLRLEPVILHEQANEGKTIIEKFETNSDVAFATVLLTPDDLGYPAGKPDMIRPRARQNVIMELGFFLGRLGRGRVAVLYKEGVEIPSDYQGVVFIPLDDGTGWHLQLARELKQAGLDVDLNRII